MTHHQPVVSTPPILKSSAVFVLLLTMLAYTTAFAYEAGALIALGLPVDLIFDLIQLQLLPSLLASILIVSLYVGLFLPVTGLIGFAAYPKWSLLRSLPFLVAFVIWFWTMGLVETGSTRAWLLLAWIINVALLTGVLMPTFLRRSSKDLWKEVQRVASRGRTKPSTLVLHLMGCAVVLAFFAGGVSVKFQREAWITNPTEELPVMVVLRMYGNRIVTAEFDRQGDGEKVKLKSNYRLMNIDSAGVVLERRRLTLER